MEFSGRSIRRLINSATKKLPLALVVSAHLLLGVGCVGDFHSSGLLTSNSAPSLASVVSTSSASKLTVGSELIIEATFSAPILVDGTPGLKVIVGTEERWASYISGSGSTVLVFGYTIQEGDEGSEIKLTSNSPFSENSGSFSNKSGKKVTPPVPESIAENAIQKDSVTVQIDGVRPSITAVSSPDPAGTYGVGSTLTIWVQFNEPIQLTASGNPRITLETGALDRISACIIDPLVNTRLSCSYTVQSGDVSGDLNYTTAALLNLNGNTIADLAGNTLFKQSPSTPDGSIELPATTSGNSLADVESLGIDGVAPQVSYVDAVEANATYGIGDSIQVRVHFDENVTVSTSGGTPELLLETGTTDRAAMYSSGSGTSSLIFNYTIASGDESLDLNTQSSASLTLEGGSITDSAGNAASLTLPNNTGGDSLAGRKSIVIDGIAPSITDVSSTTVDGTYSPSYPSFPVNIRLTFSEDIVFTPGTGGVSLTTNAQTISGVSAVVSRTVSYSGGSTLDLSYDISPGEQSGDLDADNTSALALTGTATIQDAAGNTAVLTLPTPGAAGSLSANKNIKISGRSNTVEIVSSKHSAFDTHRCARFANGGIRCWGNNDSGQLGVGNTNVIGDDEWPITSGTSPSLGFLATQIAAGEEFTCALADGGAIKCWGKNDTGQAGQDNSAGNPTINSPPMSTLNLGGARAKQVAAGNSTACALLDNGSVRCWGDNDHGEIGVTGNTGGPYGFGVHPSSITSAPAVSLPANRFATQISLGAHFACALLDDGKVFCWGSHGFGRLGQNTAASFSNTPLEVALPVGAHGKPIQISCGFGHSCALLGDGSVMCWGAGGNGRLGNGGTSNIGSSAVSPSRIADATVVSLLRPALKVEVGGSHSCALLDDGRIQCWGRNAEGQLGLGHSNDIGDNETPTDAINLGSGIRAIDLALGFDTTCALLSIGEIKCWGNNSRADVPLGYPGLAATNIGASDSPSSHGYVSVGGNFFPKKVATGDYHSCALFTDGSLNCWGNHSLGQLGRADGDSVGAINVGDDETPRDAGILPIARDGTGSGAVKEIEAHTDTTCAVFDNGTAKCWGANGSNGLIGQGNTVTAYGDVAVETIDLLSPIHFGAGHLVRSIKMERDIRCALLSDGQISCWGNNATTNGALGIGDTTSGAITSPATPRMVMSSEPARDLSVRNRGGCALLTDGKVACWGQNTSGELGLGTTTNQADMTAASAINFGGVAGVGAIALSGGGSHTCATLANGESTCWGAGGSGQLGLTPPTPTHFGDNAGEATLNDRVGAMSDVMMSFSATDTSCHINSQRDLRCWGANSAGNLGVGNTTSDSSLKSVTNGNKIADLSLSYQNTCALYTNGNIKCWGDGSQGQLGQPTLNGSTYGNDASETPINMPGVIQF